MNILARAMIDIGKEIQRNKDDIATEKYLRENAERDNKKLSEERDKYRSEMLSFNKMYNEEKEKVKFLQGEIDVQKKIIERYKKRKRRK